MIEIHGKKYLKIGGSQIIKTMIKMTKNSYIFIMGFFHSLLSPLIALSIVYSILELFYGLLFGLFVSLISCSLSLIYLRKVIKRKPIQKFILTVFLTSLILALIWGFIITRFNVPEYTIIVWILPLVSFPMYFVVSKSTKK